MTVALQPPSTQDLLALDNYSLFNSEDDPAVNYYDASPHHTLDFSANMNALEPAHHEDFFQLDFRQNTAPNVLTELLETSSWPLLGTNPISPVPLLDHGNTSRSSPTSMGTTAGTSSLEGLGASSPWDFNISWNPPL